MSNLRTTPLSPFSPVPHLLSHFACQGQFAPLQRGAMAPFTPLRKGQVGSRGCVNAGRTLRLCPIPSPGPRGTSTSSHLLVKLLCPAPGWDATCSVQHNRAATCPPINSHSANTPPPPANATARCGCSLYQAGTSRAGTGVAWPALAGLALAVSPTPVSPTPVWAQQRAYELLQLWVSPHGNPRQGSPRYHHNGVSVCCQRCLSQSQPRGPL